MSKKKADITPPDLNNPSLDYHLLFETARTHLQKLSGEIWTDHNIHDPGITILEALCYTITDLGYRTGMDIKDLLVANSGATALPKDNAFFSAEEIIPAAPTSLIDYRKLLADLTGVSNAWVVKSGKEHLGYYDVMLEFDEHPTEGNLNSSQVNIAVPIDGKTQNITLRFPYWDELDGLWWDEKDHEVKSVKITFVSEGAEGFHPSEFQSQTLTKGPCFEDDYRTPYTFLATIVLQFGDDPTQRIERDIFIDIQNDVTQEGVSTALENLDLWNGEDGIIQEYRARIKAIGQIVAQANTLLHQNRNLCEDFRQLKSTRLQEIGIRADIILAQGFNPEETLAEVYQRLYAFLQEDIRFYSLKEMQEKGYETDQILDGPLLRHGFIDTSELSDTEKHAVIYTSDLSNIITNVEGVVAVKSLFISSFINKHLIDLPNKNQLSLASPDRYKPILKTDKLTLCLTRNHEEIVYDQTKVKNRLFELIHERKHVKKPKTIEDLLPFPIGNDRETERYISPQILFPNVYGIGEDGLPSTATEERKAQARQLKAYLLFFEQLIANHLSLLAHTRNLFSISSKINQTYFSQSLVQEPDSLRILELLRIGREVILEMNASTQCDKPRRFQEGDTYLDFLQPEWEDEELFKDRRNRFLDHMMARFSEDLDAYSLIEKTLNKGDAALDLIQDKQNFLARYPQISQGRGTAYNYTQINPTTGLPDIWDTVNISGFQKRVYSLLGFDHLKRSSLSGVPTRRYPTIFSVDTELTDVERMVSPNSGEGFYVLEGILFNKKGIRKSLGDQTLQYHPFHIAIVLPAYRGRMAHPDFQRHVERTINDELPAHLIPQFHWVEFEPNMMDFEQHYLNWLTCKSMDTPLGFKNSSAHLAKLQEAETNLIQALFQLDENDGIAAVGSSKGMIIGASDNDPIDNPFVVSRYYLKNEGIGKLLIGDDFVIEQKIHVPCAIGEMTIGEDFVIAN